ncbi:MAG TPA: 4-hydroxy-tetrahydrodipicolinate synthase [Gemmatimonadaceae bacterium]|nr:4-hydroxy-tetrahydrodipicolinate synthase [Gemmatimonadaceae bacterium]
MTTKLLTGCFTALVTPFRPDGSFDEATFRALVDWQIAEGISGLVPCGSTGEAATMSLDERVRVVRTCVEQAAGRVPVIAGAGGNDTRVAIETSRAMVDAGATHLLHVSPAYSKPPQRGLIAHFRAIADAAGAPVMLYNVPGRTASNMEAETTLALAEHPNIVAVKEASGSLAQMSEIIRGRPDHFAVICGDDPLTLGLIAAGGHGIVSVVSNAVPHAMAQLAHKALAGDFGAAQAIHLRLTPYFSAAFVESNPLPVKASLAMMKRIGNVLRLPLVPMDPRHEPRVRAALVAAGALAS